MKKILLTVTSLLLLLPVFSKAQCLIQLDAGATVSNSSSTYTVTTAQANELIMIMYNGWPSPGNGPVTVDGNPAVHVNTGFDNNNSGIAEVYAYAAPAAGLHNVVCTEPNYSSPYYLNGATAFHVNGCVLKPANITSSTVSTVTCTTGGPITNSITTVAANSMLYCDAENNNGESTSFPFSWTNATFLTDIHVGNGIQSSQAYQPEAVAGLYTITASNLSPLNNGCGGLALILVAIKPCVCVLPVELLNFDCTNTGNGIQLNWATATETNSSFFTLERSTDGREFTEVAKVPAAGNSESRKNYTYVDPNPGNGPNYYQLSETDLDGTSQTFNISECDYAISTSNEIYPNPNQGNFTISVNASASYQTLVITDMLGKQILEKQFEPSTNNASYNVSLPFGCKGLFIAKLKNNNQVIAVKKLVVY